MSDLRVDTSDLREAGAGLRLVATEFDNAERITDDYAALVGHPVLAQRLHEFSGNWDDRRGEMLESIRGLAQVAAEAGETYEEIERELVRALTGEGG